MDRYDVFISYAQADKDWVHVLAENLRNAGLEVFLDAWEIAEGDVLVHELDRGLRDSSAWPRRSVRWVLSSLHTARPKRPSRLTLRSLFLHLELQVPQVGIDLHWLGRQRAALGEDRFRELVAESVGEESLEAVLGMLDQYAASQDEDASASGAKGKPE